jgi:acyl carrier protein
MEPLPKPHIPSEGTDGKIATTVEQAPVSGPASEDPAPMVQGGGKAPAGAAPEDVRVGRRIERAISRLLKPLYLPVRRFFTGVVQREILEGHNRQSREIAAMAENLHREMAGRFDRLEFQMTEIQDRQDWLCKKIARMEENLAAVTDLSASKFPERIPEKPGVTPASGDSPVFLKEVLSVLGMVAPDFRGTLTDETPLGAGGAELDSIRVLDLVLELERRTGRVLRCDDLTGDSLLTAGALARFLEKASEQ